jgi:hypothetical protein
MGGEYDGYRAAPVRGPGTSFRTPIRMFREVMSRGKKECPLTSSVGSLQTNHRA